MIYYQVQSLLQDDWHAYGEAFADLKDAKYKYLEFLMLKDQSYEQPKAVRLVSVWQTWDKVWRVKEVMDFKEFTA